MSLTIDLLEQARHLARRERGKPKQASLRRALSSAYYALFHLLSEEAAAQSVPASVGMLRPITRRAINHSDLRKVCNWFVNNSLPKDFPWRRPASADLRLVAQLFLRLQENRHEADYDMTIRYTRTGVIALVEDAENAFATWNRIRATDEGRAFLLLLFITDRWRR
jgi:uncharacterized protein (UPF0332 family)